MKTKQPLIIILLVVATVAVLSFVFIQSTSEDQKQSTLDKLVKTSETGIQVFVEDRRLLIDKQNFIITETLLPKLEVRNTKLGKIGSISLDDSQNILADKLSPIEVKRDKKNILIETPYALKPSEHAIEITTIIDDQEISEKFSFVLLIRDTFDAHLDNSKLWIIPESTKQNHTKSWYIKDNLLRIDSLPLGPHASLAFLYAFSGDVTVDFSLETVSETVNLVVYFLERERSFIIGNGDNYSMALIHDQGVERGDDFSINPDKRYRVRVIREDSIYKLFIAEERGEQLENFVDVFSDATPLIIFTDLDHPPRINDHIGLTAWGKTGGVVIDNVVISGYAIY